MEDDEVFGDTPLDPEGMQRTIDRLKAEGRMPTPEKLREVMAKAREEWRQGLVAGRPRRRKPPASPTSARWS